MATPRPRLRPSFLVAALFISVPFIPLLTLPIGCASSTSFQSLNPDGGSEPSYDLEPPTDLTGSGGGPKSYMGLTGNNNCSLILQDCGPGLKCTTHDGVTSTCDPDGSVQLGESCITDSTGADNCIAGTFCTDEGNGMTECRALCQRNVDCGTGSYCYYQLDNGPYGVCTVPCNAEPPAQDGCQLGLSCFAFYKEYTDCTSPGPNPTGFSCSSAFDCQTANTCIFDANGNGTCSQICQSDLDCSGMDSCLSVFGPNGNTWPDYGYCG